MALKTLIPNAAVQDSVTARLVSMTREPNADAAAFGGAATETLGLSAPHPVFNLGLDAIDKPEWLRLATMTGWRYFVTSEAGPVATAEAGSRSRGGDVTGTLTNQGPFVLGSEQALAVSERAMEQVKGDYVLAMLRVPALYLVCLWLRSEKAVDRLDRFVPVDPAPSPFVANKVLQPSDFIARLRELKASHDASAGGADSASN